MHYTPCPGRFAFGHLLTLSNEDKVSYFLSFCTGIIEYRGIQCAKTFTIFVKFKPHETTYLLILLIIAYTLNGCSGMVGKVII